MSETTHRDGFTADDWNTEIQAPGYGGVPIGGNIYGTPIDDRLINAATEIGRLKDIIAGLCCLRDMEYYYCPGYKGVDIPNEMSGGVFEDEPYCQVCEAKRKAGL